MSDYHNQIMNIRFGIDTRGAAAEIALEADKRIAELEAELAEAKSQKDAAIREHLGLHEQIDRAIDNGIADTEEEKKRRLAAESRVAELEAQIATLRANAEEDKGANAALLAELRDACERWNRLSAQLTGTKNMLSGQTKRANKYAELHAALVRESGPALVKERERVATLETALKFVLHKVEDSIDANTGQHISASAYFRIYKAVTVRLYGEDVKALQSALAPDARQSALGEGGRE